MPIDFPLPTSLKKAGWKVKIREKETREPPHVTILRGTQAWRVNLRTGEFMDTRPDPDDGQEGDLLGLFIGPELAHEGDEPMPPQIILFLENLWDEAEGNERTFRKEVRITYLHELGHYLGLDEDDLFERGLE